MWTEMATEGERERQRDFAIASFARISFRCFDPSHAILVWVVFVLKKKKTSDAIGHANTRMLALKQQRVGALRRPGESRRARAKNWVQTRRKVQLQSCWVDGWMEKGGRGEGGGFIHCECFKWCQEKWWITLVELVITVVWYKRCTCHHQSCF